MCHVLESYETTNDELRVERIGDAEDSTAKESPHREMISNVVVRIVEEQDP